MFTLIGVAAVITVVALVSVAGPTSLSSFAGVAEAASGEGAQAPTTAAQTGPAPKTSWGEPDLQGIWTREYDVALQRPPKYKDQQFFTDAQLAELDTVRAARPGNETRSVRGTEVDLAGAYNVVFTSRRHTGRQTSLVVDPPDGRIPPLTPGVQARNREIREFQLALLEATDTCKNKWPGCEGGKYTGVASPRRNEPLKYYNTGNMNRADGPEYFGMGTRCMSAGMPDFLGSTGGFLQFVQSPRAVSIFYDTGQGQGWQRVIPVDGSLHLPAHVRQWWGDSRGRWEGNTLVVDVTNFSPKTNFQNAGQNLHLVERWTRTGANTIEYVVTMDDPTTWTKPWTVKMELGKQEDKYNRIYKEPRCHEGNFGLIAILAGARAQEKGFAEGRGPDPATVNVAAPTGSANTIGMASGDEPEDPLPGAGFGS